MFSLPLFKQTLKSNGLIWGVITTILTLLCIQFSALEMTQSMLFVIFYGMMTTILPGIYILVAANKLIASQVDRGAMAYVLSTPTKRSTIVFTQGIFMFLSLVAMFGVMTFAHLMINMANPTALAKFGYTMLAGNLTSAMIIQINLSALVVCLALASVCFAFSAIFNTTQLSLGFSGTFIGVMILSNMLTMFGNMSKVAALENMKYFTLCTFYDYKSILLANNDWIGEMIVPLIIVVTGFVISLIAFKKKDLPL